MAHPQTVTTAKQAIMMRNHLTSLFLSAIKGSSPDPVRLYWEAVSARWFRGVWISGIVVALGCTLEIWEVTVDFANWLRHRKNRDPIPDNPGSWRYPFAALGLFLVVGGIVSETVCEVLVSNAESQLRAHISDVLSVAENKAEDADKRANKLELSNRDLTIQIRDARKETDSFGRDIVSANRQAAKAESDFADSLERTKRLEAQLSWRTLSQEQRSEIRKTLMRTGLLLPLEGWTVTFTRPEGCPECEEYTRELMGALDRLGATIVGPITASFPSTPVGVTFKVNTADSRAPIPVLLSNSFRRHGIPVHGEVGTQIPKGTISVIVGIKRHDAP